MVETNLLHHLWTSFLHSFEFIFWWMLEEIESHHEQQQQQSWFIPGRRAGALFACVFLLVCSNDGAIVKTTRKFTEERNAKLLSSNKFFSLKETDASNLQNSRKGKAVAAPLFAQSPKRRNSAGFCEGLSHLFAAWFRRRQSERSYGSSGGQRSEVFQHFQFFILKIRRHHIS